MLVESIFKQTTQILFHVFPYNFLLQFGKHTLRWIGGRYIYIYIYVCVCVCVCVCECGPGRAVGKATELPGRDVTVR